MISRFCAVTYVAFFTKSLIAIFLFASLIIPGLASAQNIEFTAELDTNVIRIGEQTGLRYELKVPKGKIADFPQINDTISGIEVLDIGIVDSIVEGLSTLYSQRFIITAFDSGFYVIPPVFLSNDSARIATDKTGVSTEALLLEVRTVVVDTSKAIKDIKGLQQMPFSWQEALPYLFGVIGLILFGLLIYYLIKKQKNKALPEVNIPARPAHELALEELKILKDSKLWQKGLYKEYHSKISDILRQFIAGRWRIHAMELTTDEIMRLNDIMAQTQPVKQDLESVLTLADLVKFAKLIPGHEDNEKSMSSAVAFVNSNIPDLNGNLQNGGQQK